MKRKKLHLLIFLLTMALFVRHGAQQQSASPAITPPNPSAASMSAYSSLPVSYQTGVPNISFDLISLPTINSRVNVKLSLNYHSGSVTSSLGASYLGQGWNLVGQGIISKTVLLDPDEKYDNSSVSYYKKNKFDDIYNFSTPEETGKFRFIRNTTANTFTFTKLSTFDSKIEYARDANTNTLKLNSFLVTSKKGIRYKFDLAETSTQKNVLMGNNSYIVHKPDGTDSLVLKPILRDISYNSAFMLTSITDEKGNEIVKYNYQSYYDNNIAATTQKLTSIEIKNMGTIEFNYSEELYPYLKHIDRNKLNSIILKNQNNVQIQKYVFQYTGDPSSFYLTTQPRELISFAKIGRDTNEIEKTQFTYDMLQNDGVTTWPLKSIQLPTGGKIEYDFYLTRTTPPDPYIVETEGLLRVENIRYYSQNNLAVPEKTEQYDYRFFGNPAELSVDYFAESIGAGTSILGTPVYKNVKVSDGKGYTQYYFKNPNDYPMDVNTYIRPHYNVLQAGLIEKTEKYDANGIKVSEDVYNYEIKDYGTPYPDFLGEEKFQVSYIKNEEVVTTIYLNGDAVSNTHQILRNDLDILDVYNTSVNYNNVYMERSIDSDNSIQETSYQYAKDKNNQYLISKNIIGIPLETKTVKRINVNDSNGKILSKYETIYPTTQSESDTKTSGMALPVSNSLLNAQTNTMATQLTYDKYDSKGNILQYTLKGSSSPVSIIWGYNQTQPIAKVEGIAYSQLETLANTLMAASNTEAGNAPMSDESSFLTALDTFRKDPSLSGAQITTYTYDPLVGVRSITPPSGIRESYIYDSANRLQKVVDSNGKILKDYQYNYKH